MSLGWVVLLCWLSASVGIVLGAWWMSVFAARTINRLEGEIAESDHARYVRQEERLDGIADEAWLLDEAGA